GRFELIDGLPELLMACHDALADMVEGIQAGRAISDGMALTRAIREFRAAPQQVAQWRGDTPLRTAPPAEAMVREVSLAELPLADEPLSEPPVGTPVVCGCRGVSGEGAGGRLQPGDALLA